MRRHIMQTGGGGPLPEGYTQLSYIESTGTQYLVISGYYPSTSSTVTGRYKLTTAPLSVIFQSGKDSNRVMLCPVNSTRIDYCFGSGYKTLNVGSGYSDLGTWYDFTMTCNSLTINGHDFSITGTANVTPAIELHLFAANFGTGDLTVRPNALAHIAFSNPSRSIDLYPALRDSDSKPGMYDIVNDVFYTNAGTGEFVYEPVQ
ncbi:MAG: hypothetical protein K6A41_04375 [Bacteroidales bacterium]|nr:hypothetical protein [Bacteroidales bacterium]